MEDAYFDVSMPLEVEYCKATYIAQSINMYRKLPEEVNDSRRARWQGIPQYERSEQDREDLFSEDHDLHREQFSELFVYLSCTSFSCHSNYG